MPPPNIKLTLDYPWRFCTQPGFQHAVQASGFRPLKDSYNNTHRDGLTGVVTLRPSILTPDFINDFRGLSEWRHEAAYWREIRRARSASGFASMYSTVSPAGSAAGNIELLTNIAILAVEASDLANDQLKWALQSSFFHGEDQGFVIHYSPLSDPFARKRNWFALAIWDIGIHFSQSGEVRVFRYDMANMSAFPTFVERFNIASPGELMGSEGYFWVRPMPGLGGICLYHSANPDKAAVFSSDTENAATRGHFIKWLEYTDVYGVPHLLGPSMVSLAINPHESYALGFQAVTYPATGTYADAIVDPIYRPLLPAQVSAKTTPGLVADLPAAFLKTDLSAPFDPATDRQGRVSVTLATSDPNRTPYLYSYGVGWPAVFGTRDTTPVPVLPVSGSSNDKILRLEYTQTEENRFEGEAKVFLSSAAAKTVAARGDTTFKLERWNGVTWATIFGGLALFTPSSVDTADFGGKTYVSNATIKLRDFASRLEEVHVYRKGAADGLLFSEACNLVIGGGGFAPIPAAGFPAVFLQKRLPPPDDNREWAFAPKPQDDGMQILRVFLLFLRAQFTEWLLDFDFATGNGETGWRFVQKPRDVSDGATWTLTPFPDEAANPRTLVYLENPDFATIPPECNALSVFGLDDRDKNRSQLLTLQRLTNQASVSDNTSPDYLGRVVMGAAVFRGITTREELGPMGRRLFEAICHQRRQATLRVSGDPTGLLPNTFCLVRGHHRVTGARTTMGSYWLKRKTLVIDQDGVPVTTLHMDSQWEGNMEK